MSEEKRKQIAPLVVLAQHGNKSAYRDLYIHYYKSIFYLCRNLTGDATAAMRLTADIFIKMFVSLDKLGDHTLFEQWFYSLAINICRKDIPSDKEFEIEKETLEKLAKEASECAKNKDKFGFEHGIMRIINQMILGLPAEAKVLLFYRYAATLNEEKISVLEKISEEEVAVQLDAVKILLDKQAEFVRTFGVDVSMFLADMENTISYISSKCFVPDAVHSEVSEKIGINVNPFAITQEKKAEPEKKEPENDEPEVKEKRKKKQLFSKSDLILFFAVVAAALVVFSAVKIYYNSKNEEKNTTVSTSQQQNKPVLVWNGAAASSFDSGSGTKEDPYIIASGGQLAYLANLVNDGNSYYAACHYKLGADIILNNTDDFAKWSKKAPENEWTPIGYSADDDSHSYFTGTFDGDDHTVSGMYISEESDYAGLFGVVRNGHIKNLCVNGAYVEGKSYVGGIAGYFSADATEKSGFEYCSFSGVIKSSGNNAGGIAGYFRADGDSNTPVISDCCVFGRVNAENGYAGGITGVGEAATGNAKIINCFNAATVNAAKNAGGITGNSRCADGNSTIEGCYNAGKVTSSENAGGISGYISCVNGKGRVSIQQCYMSELSAETDVVKASSDERLVTGDIAKLSDSDMLKQESYSTFNFADVWKIDPEGDYKYPLLRGAIAEWFSVPEAETV